MKQVSASEGDCAKLCRESAGCKSFDYWAKQDKPCVLKDLDGAEALKNGRWTSHAEAFHVDLGAEAKVRESESETTQERASGDVYKELGAGACTAEFLWTRPDGEIGVGVSPPVAGSKAMLDLKGVSREACEAKCTSIDLCGAYAHIQAGEQFCNLYSGNWREGYSAKFNSDSRYKCYERQKGKQVLDHVCNGPIRALDVQS